MYGDDKTQATCPYCGNTYSYSHNEMQEGGIVSCKGCGSIIETQRQPARQQTGYPTTSDPVFSGQPQQYRKRGPSGTSVACSIILVLLFIPLIVAIPIAVCIGLWYMSKQRN